MTGRARRTPRSVFVHCSLAPASSRRHLRLWQHTVRWVPCRIAADTGWEPKAVYEHLEWLMSPNVLPFPVHIVSVGSIRDGLMDAADGRRWASIPAFTKIVTPAGAEVPVLDENEDGQLVEVSTRRTATQTSPSG